MRCRAARARDATCGATSTVGDNVRNASWIFGNGIANLKLYYMIGLPFEQHEDVEAIVTLTEQREKPAEERIRIHWARFGDSAAVATDLDEGRPPADAALLPPVVDEYARHEQDTRDDESGLERGEPHGSRRRRLAGL